MQLHIPWLAPQQQESKRRLLSPDEVLPQNPGAEDSHGHGREWVSNLQRISNSLTGLFQAAANPVVSTLPTLESTDKNPNPKNIKKLNKTSTVSQDFQRRLLFSELMYPNGEVLTWLDFMLTIPFQS